MAIMFGGGEVRFEAPDGALVEGRAVSVKFERDVERIDAGGMGMHAIERGPARVTVTFLAETTTPGWRERHDAGENMGDPIGTPHPQPPTKPSSENPLWGAF